MNTNDQSLSNVLSRTAIVDTACSKAVMGHDWFQYFYENLPEEFASRVVIHRDNSSIAFQFGDGQRIKPLGRVTIPIKVGQTHVMLKTEVVDRSIPLLLSKEFLQYARAVLDMENNRIVMFGQELETSFSRSGLLCINVWPAA